MNTAYIEHNYKKIFQVISQTTHAAAVLAL